MPTIHRLCTLLTLAFIASAGPLAAQTFDTPLTVNNLDPTAYAQWVNATETPITAPQVVTNVIYTKTTQSGWTGLKYGISNTTGPRYLRIGFKTPVAVSSILVRGGGALSVLKPTATYPGILNDDAQWIPAYRLVDGKPSTAEVGTEGYAVWVLPPGTTTRALRFSHNPAITDRDYEGWLGGVYLLSSRMANIAPQALPITSSNDNKGHLIINESNNGWWGAWDNWNESTAQVVSPEHPEHIMLVWPKEVQLSGLCALWAGFGAADVEVYTGPATLHPREAPNADWKLIKTYDNILNQYPRCLGVNWMDFGQTVSTRAVRLIITKGTLESHPHLIGKTHDGKRIWLGDLMAFMPLDNAVLSTATISAPVATIHPPIPIHFALPEAGYVTLVIDNAAGIRVRNLISETPFPAGHDVAWWDGMDDLGRDQEAANHGLYHVPGKFVQPGTYTVRGLYRKAINLRYEFSVYNAGNPPWNTADTSGAWLANHTPPDCALFVPANGTPGSKPLVYLGSAVSEGTAGLAWVDLEGHKVGGVTWVGGDWTGAQCLARDAGPQADPNISLIVGSTFNTDLRLTARIDGKDHELAPYTFDNKADAALSGMAVYNNVLVCSLPKIGQLLFVDVKANTILGKTAMADPRGLAFDSQGRLLILSGTRLLRVTLPTNLTAPFPTPDVVIDRGLEDPQDITLDSQGNLYISDQGTSHQVKVFDAQGKFLRAIGQPGVPVAGPYNPLHMNHPTGLTIDSNNHLWVTETDFEPKRVSEWTLDGKLVNAFYGPSQYGGGGTLDPTDKTLFYYQGMQFKLDWTKGASQLTDVLLRPGPDTVLPDGHGVGGLPETPLYLNGQRYFTNCYNSNPTNGSPIAMLWKDENGIAVPVAAMGMANQWSIFKGADFKPEWPQGIDLNGDYWKNQTLFLWWDRNGDGKIQPDEVTFQAATCGGVTIMPDLSFVESRVNNQTLRYAPVAINKEGIPSYDLAAGQILAKDVQPPAGDGGDQVLALPDGWTVMGVEPKPFARQSLCGVYKGQPRWSYPDPWPGLHPSHDAPTPEMPGEVIGATRLLGGSFTPTQGQAGPMWAINANMGDCYLFTADGLFVATLFHDVRQGKLWSMPIAERGMLLNDLTCHDENFWPSITETPDGNVYLDNGDTVSIVHVDGLDSIRRFPDMTLKITDADLREAQTYDIRREMVRQRYQGIPTLTVPIRTAPAITVDGKLDDWQGADWASIDKRGVAANFNSNSKPYNIMGSVAIVGDRLYAAFQTGDPNLLRNSGAIPLAPFKTGGALDLMIGANPNADPNRVNPVFGDVRVLVTMVNKKPYALIYRAVVPGTKDPVPFASPWRTITIDRVDNISDKVQLAGADGNYEFSIPLSLLTPQPVAGTTIKADIGILRGDGTNTIQRVYWSNKATGITSDVPSEAMLTPELWGYWHFVNTP